MNTVRVALVAVLLLSTTPATHGSEPAKVMEYRRHFQIVAAKDVVMYKFTDLTRVADDVDENLYLVHDEGYGDFIMRRTWSFPEQTITHRISDIKDGAFIQYTYKTSLTSRTRRETLAEGRENPQLLDTPVAVTLETNGGKWEAIDTDWNDEAELRRLRNAIRQSLDFRLLEGIERMRGSVFATPVGEVFYVHIGRLVLYDHANNTPIGSMKSRDAAPDCAFDAAFGFKCSEKQEKRVTQAAKKGLVLNSY